MNDSDWHATDADTVIARLDTDGSSGLEPDEAQRRLRHYGLNEIEGARTVSAPAIFLSQFRSILIVILLLVAALVQVPAIRESFGIALPSLGDRAIICGFGLVVMGFIKATKLLLRRRPRPPCTERLR